MQSRHSVSRDEFVDFFTSKGVSSEIAEEVRKIMLEWCDVDGFTPHPADNLGQVYGLGEEDLDEDIILSLLKKFDCYIPTIAEIESQKLDINTVAGIVEFVDMMKKKDSLPD